MTRFFYDIRRCLHFNKTTHVALFVSVLPTPFWVIAIMVKYQLEFLEVFVQHGLLVFGLPLVCMCCALVFAGKTYRGLCFGRRLAITVLKKRAQHCKMDDSYDIGIMLALHDRTHKEEGAS